MSTIAIAILVLLALGGASGYLSFHDDLRTGSAGRLALFLVGHVSQQRYGVYGGVVSASLWVCQFRKVATPSARFCPGLRLQGLRNPPETVVRTAGEVN